MPDDHHRVVIEIAPDGTAYPVLRRLCSRRARIGRCGTSTLDAALLELDGSDISLVAHLPVPPRGTPPSGVPAVAGPAR